MRGTGGSRISLGGGANLPMGGGRKHIIFTKVSEKLHEIEKMLVHRGGVRHGRPPWIHHWKVHVITAHIVKQMKVMFSQACVTYSVQLGGGGICPPGKAAPPPPGKADTPSREYGQWAGGTHPTGCDCLHSMQSQLAKKLLTPLYNCDLS